MNPRRFRAVVKIVLVSLVLVVVGQIQPAKAAAVALTDLSDTFERLKADTTSNQTIQFTSTSGVVNGDIIDLQYPAGEFLGFGHGQLGQDDVEVYNVTTASTYTDDGTGCGGAEEVDVGILPDIIRLTFCPGSGSHVSAGDVIKIYVGAFTAETVEDGDYKMTNPFLPAEEVIRIYTGPVGLSTTWDEGKIAVSIIDDDQVNIRANIDPTFTFDIDVASSDTETAAPYVLDLGTLSKTAVVGSNHGTIKSIWIDLETNATSGAVVTVSGVYGGLASTGTAHTIPGQDVALVAGTEAMGICISYTSGLSGVPPYQSGACNTSSKHSVGKVNTTATDIFTAPGPVAGGRAEILVKAAISAVTPAAPDYEDTYTFIATGTF